MKKIGTVGRYFFFTFFRDKMQTYYVSNFFIVHISMLASQICFYNSHKILKGMFST